MSKVFRIHTGQEGTGWFRSKQFSNEQLNGIKVKGKEVANSIPSPFARIDLVKSAFRWVASNGIKGNTAHHKLVSEALDIGELMFYAKKFPKLITIQEYNPLVSMGSRFGQNEVSHAELANTLQIYWNQDSDVYNFDIHTKFFFVFHRGQLIGATSPATLFISAPLDEITKNEITLSSGRGRYLNKTTSLHEREGDFILYLYILSKQDGFAGKFKELYDYLEEAKRGLPLQRREIIDRLNDSDISTFEKCHVTNAANNFCTVNGIPLLVANTSSRSEAIRLESDFIIQSDYEAIEKPPLIIPNERFSENWAYTTIDVRWNPDNSEIISQNRSADRSRLPITDDDYPWLSVDDFLHDYLIELPYEIDSKNFVVCSSQNSPRKYLLPLTETFFNYYKTDSTVNRVTLSEMGQGTVFVELIISTKGGEIKLNKSYTSDKKIKMPMHLAIMPFARLTQDQPIKYYIGYLDTLTTDNDPIDLKCFNGKNIINISPAISRNPGRGPINSKYIYVESNIDRLQINIDNRFHGYILPKFPVIPFLNKKAHFAIDFGTTNTHIEYKLEENAESKIKNSLDKPLIRTLIDHSNTNIDPEYKSNDLEFEKELIPFAFGNTNDSILFPVRTAILENSHNLNFDGNVSVFQHINNFLLYETFAHPGHLNLITSLKWENLRETTNRVRLKSFISGLLHLVLYRALFDGVKSENVRITWFYPTSMTKYHQGEISNAWNEKFRAIFGIETNKQNMRGLPESVAPYYYYKRRGTLTGLSCFIDIGGGSTDIAVHENEKIKLISSFKFAGDSIFGDGYGRNPSRNGFIITFKEVVNNLQTAGFYGDDRLDILRDIIDNRESSTDFSNYLFALSKSGEHQFSYSDEIRNEGKLKFLVVFFYFAITYYLSKLFKNQQIDIPKNIVFTGTGSKTIDLIDTTPEKNLLSTIMTFVFGSVHENQNVQQMKIELSKYPKEITAKGGLYFEGNPFYQNIFWSGGEDNIDRNVIKDEKKSYLKSAEFFEYKRCVKKSSLNLYSIMDDFFSKYDIKNLFGIDHKVYEIFKDNRSKEIDEFIDLGYKTNKPLGGDNEDDIVEETLFFYPIIGVISRLSYEISKI